MDLERDFPTLGNLLGAGFNQDFWEIDGSPEAVISQFTSSSVFAARLPSDVARITARYQGADLDQALLELGNNYAYEEDGFTGETWLAEVLAQVKRERPAPDARHLALVGQEVVGVASRPEVAVTLTRHVVTFPAGVSVSGPDGTGKVLRRGDLRLLAGGIGELLLAAEEIQGQFILATPHVRLYSLPIKRGLGFHIDALDQSG